MFCGNCGNNIVDSAKFCSQCGWQALVTCAEYEVSEQQICEVAVDTEVNLISDKWAWTLATLPYSVGIMMTVVGFDDSSYKITVCMIAINIVCLYLDYNELEKSGKKPSSWIWMGFILVPIYLFVRAKKTNGNYGYFILWFVMLFIAAYIM